MIFYQKDPILEELGNKILGATWQQFPELARNQIAMTWLVYDPPFPVNMGGAIADSEFWKYPIRGFGYRGLELFYPASVVKLFYLVAVQEWLGKGMISTSPELERAIRDMIVNSSNDAASLVVDVLTGTTSGPELPPEPFKTWQGQRNIVNRYFQSLGWEELQGINVNQKTWGDGSYGRERASLGEYREHQNHLTTDATARLLHSIVGGVAVSGERSQIMLKLMERSLDRVGLEKDQENQVQGFLGEGLPLGTKLWSKAGWMNQIRHDAAYIELPQGLPYSLVVFTESVVNKKNKLLLPFLSQQVATAMATLLG